MENKDYLYKSTSKFLHIIKDGRIDLLQEHFPDAQALLSACENCKDHQYDIMNTVTNYATPETLKKLLSTYFPENTPQSNELKKRFLLSHQYTSKPKDFHFFKKFLSPEEQAREDYIFTGRSSSGNDTRNEEQKRKAEIYYVIRDEYQKANLSQNLRSQRPKKEESLGIAPAGALSDEFRGYTSRDMSKAGKIEWFHEVYPTIVLETYAIDPSSPNFEKNLSAQRRLVNQEDNARQFEEQLGSSETIKGIKYKSGKSLKESVYKSLHFPDLYPNQTFDTLDTIDKAYSSMRDDDPLASIYTKSFRGNIVVQNTREYNSNGNSFEGIDYGGYSNGSDIAIRSGFSNIDETLYHELTHNTDKEFKTTDAYKFVATLMAAKPNASRNRDFAVNKTLQYYPANQYFTESLARVLEKYPQSQHQDDPLLASCSKLFAIYGHNKANNISNKRLELSMRMRLLNYNGYNEAFSAMNQRNTTKNHKEGNPDGFYYQDKHNLPQISDEDLKASEEKFLASVANIYPDTHKSLNFPETKLIEAIDKEIEVYKKIYQTPNAEKIELDLDTIGRDGINDEVPLEVEVANSFNSANKLYGRLSNAKSAEDCQQELGVSAVKDLYNEFKAEEKEGRPLDRYNLNSLVAQTTKMMHYNNKLVKKHFPDISLPEPQIKDCVPNTISSSIKKVENAQNNITFINSVDENIRINPEVISNPYVDIQNAVQKVDDYYAKNKDFDDLRIARFNEDAPRRGFISNYFSNLREAQHIYKALHPEAEKLPDDLKFSSLTKETIDGSNDKTPLICQTLTKYADYFIKKYEAIENGENLNVATNQIQENTAQAKKTSWER